VIDVVLFSLNGIDWRSIDKYMIVSQIKEYGSAEFNDYRLWDYKQGG
jgi:hypothetical protein